MDDENLRPVVPDGTHLVWSKSTEGRKRALLFDDETGALIGPAELEYVEDDNSTDDASSQDSTADDAAAALLVAAAAIALVVLAAIVVERAGPPLVRWWRNRFVPAIKKRWERMFGLDLSDIEVANTQLAITTRDPQPQFAVAVEAVVEQQRESMSNQEAQQRLLAMFLAAGLIAEQVRALSNARIDDVELRKIQAAMQTLTASEVTEQISRMLEQNPSLLDRDALPEFVRLFGPGKITDGVYFPLSNQDVKNALSLPGTNSDPDDLDTGLVRR